MAYNKLAALLGGSIPSRPATEAPIGTGMAAEASKVLQSSAYRNHVREALADGKTPLTPEEWAKQQAGKQ